MENYSKIKDYWTALLKPYFKKSHLTEKLRIVLERKEVGTQVGTAMWKYKLGNPITPPSAPVIPDISQPSQKVSVVQQDTISTPVEPLTALWLGEP